MNRWRWCACFLGVYLAWAAACVLIRRSYAPPSDVRTIESFVSHFGQPERVESFGSDYVVATLHVPVWQVMLNLPSDMPEYVFNRSGDLVDWSYDPGDDPSFQERWSKARRVPLIVGSSPTEKRQR
jgi:hypothetical protein